MVETQESTIKGLVVRNLINEVKKQKGPEGLEELKGILGEEPKISPFHDYPIKDHVKLNEAICEVLFGGNNPENQYKLGQLLFSSHANEGLGKAMINQMKVLGYTAGIDTLKVLIKGSELLTKGPKYTIKNLGDNKIKMLVENSSYPTEYIKGFMDEGIKLGTDMQKEKGQSVKVKTQWTKLGADTHQVIFEWE